MLYGGALFIQSVPPHPSFPLYPTPILSSPGNFELSPPRVVEIYWGSSRHLEGINPISPNARPWPPYAHPGRTCVIQADLIHLERAFSKLNYASWYTSWLELWSASGVADHSSVLWKSETDKKHMCMPRHQGTHFKMKKSVFMTSVLWALWKYWGELKGRRFGFTWRRWESVLYTLHHLSPEFNYSFILIGFSADFSLKCVFPCYSLHIPHPLLPPTPPSRFIVRF